MTITMAQAVRIIDLTKEDLINLIKEAVEANKQCPPCNEPKPEIKLFYTREETCKLLNVSLSTLQNWKKESILVPVKVRGRVLYPRMSIESFLQVSA